MSILSRNMAAGWLVLACIVVGCGKVPDEPAKPPAAAPPMKPVSVASDLWPMFMHDQYHHGVSTADFPSAKLEEAWKYRGSEHTWVFEQGASVWASPVVGRIDGREVVFSGCYDRCVYALDAATGEDVWRFTAGAPVYAAAAVWSEHDPPMVFVAATDRTIYGLNATNRKKLWAFECMEWADGVVCRMSAVTLADLGGKMTAFVGAWTSNPTGFRGEQNGEVVALDAATGDLRWRRRLSSGPVFSPIVVTIDGRRTLFVTAFDGNLHALDAATGEPVWSRVADEFTRSQPTFAVLDGRPVVFHGTRYHNVIGRNARTGDRVWKFMTHFWVDSTPAFARIGGKPMLFFGSYDRNIFAVNGTTQQKVWNTGTGGDICSSVAVAKIAGKPAAFVHSLDDHLYGVDAASGKVLWKQPVGKLLWTHADRGDSIWASPCIAVVQGKPMLFFDFFYGYLYAFRCK